MAKELLAKIPVERRWEITSKILTTIMAIRGANFIVPLLGLGEGIIAPVMGWEKYEEITEKIWGDGGKRFIPRIKEMFNISVKNAIEAAKLLIAAATLLQGPEHTGQIIETRPERAILRVLKCAWMERYKEFEITPGFRVCGASCPGWGEEGLKAINPNFTYKGTQLLPKGDPYCERIIELKEEKE
jgi:hypothetical protein